MKLYSAAAIASLISLPAAAQDGAVTEAGCAAIVQAEGESAQVLPIQDFSVLEMTRTQGPFQLQLPEEYEVQGVLCERSSIMPQPDDFYAPVSGYPLYLETYDGETKSAVGKLTVTPDGFEYDVLLGELTGPQQAALAPLLDDYLIAYREAAAELGQN